MSPAQTRAAAPSKELLSNGRRLLQMLPIALLATALFTAPLAASPVEPVVSPVVAVQATPAAFSPTATVRVNQTTITVKSAVAGTLELSVAEADGTPI